MPFGTSIPFPLDWMIGNQSVCMSRNVVDFLYDVGRRRTPFGKKCQNDLSAVSCACLSQTEMEWFASRRYLCIAHNNGSAVAEAILSDRGRSFASYLAECVRRYSIPDAIREETYEWALCAADGMTPFWDSQSYDLWLGPILVKHFRRRAVHQMMILDRFQKAGWPAAIRDPLPLDEREPINPKRRLNLTLKNMNRSLNTDLVKFCGDGTGTGVFWKRIP